MSARLAAMSPAERASAGQRADLLGAVGLGLKGFPYAERAAVLAHMTPALVALGTPAAAITAFDPTDDALDVAVAQAKTLHDRLGIPPPDLDE